MEEFPRRLAHHMMPKTLEMSHNERTASRARDAPRAACDIHEIRPVNAEWSP